MADKYSTAISHYSPSKGKVMYVHACFDCGALRHFNMKHIKAVRCQSCRTAFERANPTRPSATCQNCNRQFKAIWRKGRPQPFCSVACFNEHQTGASVTIICKHCRKTFSIKPCQAKRVKAECCSNACKVAHHKWQECPYCHRQFNARHNKERVYCSKRCFLSSWGETRIEKVVRKSLHILNLEAVPQYKVPGAHHFDFFVPSLNLLIEADGTYWHSLPGCSERDARKTAKAIDKGFRVERFPESLIMSDDWFMSFRQALSKYPEFTNPRLPL